jgi:hypothetical protein
LGCGTQRSAFERFGGRETATSWRRPVAGRGRRIPTVGPRVKGGIRLIVVSCQWSVDRGKSKAALGLRPAINQLCITPLLLPMEQTSICELHKSPLTTDN